MAHVTVWETGKISFSTVLGGQFSNASAAQTKALALASPGTPVNLGLCQAVATALTVWLQRTRSQALLGNATTYFSWATDFNQLFGEDFLTVDVGSVSVDNVIETWAGEAENSLTFISLHEVSFTVTSSSFAWLRALPWFDQTSSSAVSAATANNSLSILSARRLLNLEEQHCHDTLPLFDSPAAIAPGKNCGEERKQSRRQTLEGVDASLFVTALQVSHISSNLLYYVLKLLKS